MRRPFDPNLWRGRTDNDAGGPHRWHEVVRSADHANPNDVALVGLASDAGVARNQGRVGAAEGPRALRRMLSNLPLSSGLHVVDAGDVVCEEDQLESAQAEYADVVSSLLARGAHVIGLGGGHEIAFGTFSGLAAHVPNKTIGVVNLDAHFDLRPTPPPTSGTPFFQIEAHCRQRGLPFRYFCLGISEFSNTRALFQRAASLHAQYVTDEQLRSQVSDVTKRLRSFCEQVDAVYLTICLDVLPAYVAPGVSAPAAAGVELATIETLIDTVVSSGRLRVTDIAELNPRFDIDNRTARVAARLVARVARGLASPA